MSKKLSIEKANKRLLNESMPPMIYFNEFEVSKMLCEAIGCKDITEMPQKVKEVLQKALIEKGRNLTPPNPPPGAML